MKRNVLIRAICIFLVFSNFLFSFNNVIAYAADNISKQPKGEYYGKDINERTDKVKTVNQTQTKSTKALRKPSVTKEKRKNPTVRIRK